MFMIRIQLIWSMSLYNFLYDDPDLFSNMHLIFIFNIFLNTLLVLGDIESGEEIN